ncbi:MAG: tetratricopeptide repeat protein [Gammaproteobacteria bacterium]
MKYIIQIGLSLVLLAGFAAWWRWQPQQTDTKQSAPMQAVSTEQQNASEESQLQKPVARRGRSNPAAEDAAATVLQRTKAKDPADTQAQVALGDSYLAGTGVKSDPAQAAYWYRQAADQGDAAAQVRLGQLYEQGIGVEQDVNEALGWYTAAADQGGAADQANVGDFYESGPGIRSDKAAVHYYRLAAAHGYRDAQADLGRMYELGKGVAADPAQAYRWYARAAAQGDTVSAKNRDRMRRELSPAQIAEAERQVN